MPPKIEYRLPSESDRMKQYARDGEVRFSCECDFVCSLDDWLSGVCSLVEQMLHRYTTNAYVTIQARVCTP